MKEQILNQKKLHMNITEYTWYLAIYVLLQPDSPELQLKDDHELNI